MGFWPVGLEVNVDLLADDERAGIRQIYSDLQHIDIAELARIAGIDPARPDHARDRGDAPVEFAAVERAGPHQHRLPDPDAAETLLADRPCQ